MFVSLARYARFLLVLTTCSLLIAACDSSGDDEEAMIEVEILEVGDGAEATAGSTVTVDYEGRLENGTLFDEAEGATFSLSRVIPGFREGIVGMRVGGRRRITIPPELAYGAAGRPQAGIPPNATLIFEVTLRGVQ